jgi:hypothetical protein
VIPPGFGNSDVAIGEFRLIFAYIRSLPVTGDIMPAPVPPDRAPETSYVNTESVMPKAPF